MRSPSSFWHSVGRYLTAKMKWFSLSTSRSKMMKCKGFQGPYTCNGL